MDASEKLTLAKQNAAYTSSYDAQLAAIPWGKEPTLEEKMADSLTDTPNDSMQESVSAEIPEESIDPVIKASDPVVQDPNIELAAEPNKFDHPAAGVVTQDEVSIQQDTVLPRPSKIPGTAGIEAEAPKASISTNPKAKLLDEGVWGKFDDTSFEILKWDAFKHQEAGDQETADIFIDAMANSLAHTELEKYVKQSGDPIESLYSTAIHQQYVAQATNTLRKELQIKPSNPIFYEYGLTSYLDVLNNYRGVDRPEVDPTLPQQLSGGATAALIMAFAVPEFAPFLPVVGKYAAAGMPSLSWRGGLAAAAVGAPENIIDLKARQAIDKNIKDPKWNAAAHFALTLSEMGGFGLAEGLTEYGIKKVGRWFNVAPLGQKLNVVNHIKNIKTEVLMRMLSLGDAANPNLINFRRSITQYLVNTRNMSPEGMLQLAKLEGTLATAAKAHAAHPNRSFRANNVFLDKQVLKAERQKYYDLVTGLRKDGERQILLDDIVSVASKLMGGVDGSRAMQELLQDAGINIPVGVDKTYWSPEDITKLSALAMGNLESDGVKLASTILKYGKIPAPGLQVSPVTYRLVYKQVFADEKLMSMRGAFSEEVFLAKINDKLSKAGLDRLDSVVDIDGILQVLELADTITKANVNAVVDASFEGYMTDAWGFEPGRNIAYDRLAKDESRRLQNQVLTLIAREADPSIRPEVQIDDKVRTLFEQVKLEQGLSEMTLKNLDKYFDFGPMAETNIKARMVNNTKHIQATKELLGVDQLTVDSKWGQDSITIQRAIAFTPTDLSKVKQVRPITFDPTSVQTLSGIQSTVESVLKAVKQLDSPIFGVKAAPEQRTIRLAQLFNVLEGAEDVINVTEYDKIAQIAAEIHQLPLGIRQAVQKELSKVANDSTLLPPPKKGVTRERVEPITEVRQLQREGKVPEEINSILTQYDRELASTKNVNNPASWGDETRFIDQDALQYLYEQTPKESLSSADDVAQMLRNSESKLGDLLTTKTDELGNLVVPIGGDDYSIQEAQAIVQKAILDLGAGKTPDATAMILIRDLMEAPRANFNNTNIDEAIDVVEKSMKAGVDLTAGNIVPQDVQTLLSNLKWEKGQQFDKRGGKGRTLGYASRQTTRERELRKWLSEYKGAEDKNMGVDLKDTITYLTDTEAARLSSWIDKLIISAEDKKPFKAYMAAVIEAAEFQPGITTSQQKLAWIRQQLKTFDSTAVGEMPQANTLIDLLFKDLRGEQKQTMKEVLGKPDGSNLYLGTIDRINRAIAEADPKVAEQARTLLNRVQTQDTIKSKRLYDKNKGIEQRYLPYTPPQAQTLGAVTTDEMKQALDIFEKALRTKDSFLLGQWELWKSGNKTSVSQENYPIFQAYETLTQRVKNRVIDAVQGDKTDFNLQTNPDVNAILQLDELITADQQRLANTPLQGAANNIRLGFGDKLNNTDVLGQSFVALRGAEMRKWMAAFRRATIGDLDEGELSLDMITEMVRSAKDEYAQLVTHSDLMDTATGLDLVNQINFDEKLGRLVIPEELDALGMPDVQTVIDGASSLTAQSVFGEGLTYKQIVIRASQIFEAGGMQVGVTMADAYTGRMPLDLNALQTSPANTIDYLRLANRIGSTMEPRNRHIKGTIADKLHLSSKKMASELSPEASVALQDLHIQATKNLTASLERLKSIQYNRQVMQPLPDGASVAVDNMGLIIDALMMRKHVLQIRAIEETMEFGKATPRTIEALSMYQFDLRSPEALVQSVGEIARYAYPELAPLQSVFDNATIRFSKAMAEDIGFLDTLTGSDTPIHRLVRPQADNVLNLTDVMKQSKRERMQALRQFQDAQDKLIPAHQTTRTPYMNEDKLIRGSQDANAIKGRSEISGDLRDGGYGTESTDVYFGDEANPEFDLGD